MHLLVIEDERVLCETIVRSLRRLAYSVDHCYDGDKALELLGTERYDLVLLDLNLPGKDGMTVLRTFRQRDRKTPVLILSARSEVKDNSYGNSVTTPQDLKRPVEADATMLALCESVAGRLRMDGKTARVITVQLVDNAFRRSSHQVTLNSPTNSTDVIYHTARELMRQMWPDRPVRLVGVSAEKTGTDNFEQLDFFTDPAKTDKQEKLDRAADALRARFGEGAILRAKLLHPDEKTTAPKALGAAKARDKRKGEL